MLPTHRILSCVFRELTGRVTIVIVMMRAVHRTGLIVGNTGHFDNEIDLVGSEGLQGTQVDTITLQKIVSFVDVVFPHEPGVGAA